MSERLSIINGDVLSASDNLANAKSTDQVASSTTAQAIQESNAAKDTVSAMKRVAGKIGVIDDIEYLTKLPALNAAIEITHAGKHWKGFVVVANEIQKSAEHRQKVSISLPILTQIIRIRSIDNPGKGDSLIIWK